MVDYFLKHSLLPKIFYRLGIHWQIKNRLKNEKRLFDVSAGENKISIIHTLNDSEIALSSETANKQHYEVPTKFYRYLLGPKLKYSCCHYQQAKTLAAAEMEMLDLYSKRADIRNEQRVLDLGCGWGAFTLYAAKKFPGSHFTAVSNSTTQKEYIDTMASNNNLTNITVLTKDINQLQLTEKYDRIISIEMFEHIRNYQCLLEKISNWLCIEGKLFVHHFCHQYLIYPFNTEDSWMARHFFADGLMPSEDMLLFFDHNLRVESRWRVNGKHYGKTCYHWLDNLYRHKKQIRDLFANHYEAPTRYYEYWDIFIRSCAQLFSFNAGNEWFVAHYLFKKTTT